MEQLCKQRVELDDQADWFNQNGGVKDGSVNFGPWIDSVAGWLATSSKPELYFDLDLLAKVLGEIETRAEQSGVKLTADRKAKLTLMLYRSFKASGRIDPKMIDDAVSLAASD